MDIKIHFVGCLGVSMKTLLQLCKHKGFEVSGSDLALNGHDASNVQGADLVVYSSAIGADNPELLQAKKLNIPIISRAQMLSELMQTYQTSVAVAGSHGKTTVTGMLWESLLPLNPTIHIGGNYNHKNSKIGGDKIFISEACEYSRSFLKLFPDISIILNIDLDHTDCYKSLQDMKNAFAQFALNTKRLLIINGDEINKGDFTHIKTISVGLNKSNDYYASCLACDKHSRFSFCVFKGAKRLGRLSLSVAGKHNVINALCVIATCDYLGLSFGKIAGGLYRFKGVERRMELLGYKDGCAVFSDYAHHPREIEATLSSVRATRFSKIIAIFEPHTYTRTQSFYTQFAQSLSLADQIILLPIYPAREKPIEGITSDLILQELKGQSKNAVLLNDYNQVKLYLSANHNDDAVILFLGAGTIDNLARDYIK